MSTGKHLVCDIKHIRNTDLLGSLEQMQKLMDKICEEHRFTILQKVFHQFEPQGTTILYLLSESHFSIHTFPEHNYAAIDLYTCRQYDTNDVYYAIKKRLQEAFDSSNDTITILDRSYLTEQ